MGTVRASAALDGALYRTRFEEPGERTLAGTPRPRPVHWWNRRPDGREVDLTREQFAPHELVQQPRVVPRPPGPPRRGAARYAAFRAAVDAALSARGR